MLVLIFSLTSIAAFGVGVHHLHLSAGSFLSAWRSFLECLGLAALFYALNIGFATAVVVVTRTIGIAFISAYVTSDVVWPVFSLFQAVILRMWLIPRAMPTR